MGFCMSNNLNIRAAKALGENQMNQNAPEPSEGPLIQDLNRCATALKKAGSETDASNLRELIRVLRDKDIDTLETLREILYSGE